MNFPNRTLPRLPGGVSTNRPLDKLPQSLPQVGGTTSPATSPRSTWATASTEAAAAATAAARASTAGRTSTKTTATRTLQCSAHLGNAKNTKHFLKFPPPILLLFLQVQHQSRKNNFQAVERLDVRRLDRAKKVKIVLPKIGPRMISQLFELRKVKAKRETKQHTREDSHVK